MKDAVIKGTGNSRYLKSVADFMTQYPTYEAFAQALMAGTLPIDLNGVNANGWTQQGTPLNKASLLSDGTAANLGLTGDPTPDQAITALDSRLDAVETKQNGILPIANGGTGNSAGYVRAGKKEGETIGENATAEGLNTIASGAWSHAEGQNTAATGSGAHAEGLNSNATGNYSHAEGNETTTVGIYSHAEGSETKATGSCSHAEGHLAKAIGNYSHAEGSDAYAGGNGSHAEGNTTQAIGEFSHAEGSWTKASSNHSHAEGGLTIASGENSHAEGKSTNANNYAAHAGGKVNKDMVSGGTNNNIIGDAFVIGNGTGYGHSSSPFVKSNCFRVTYAGETYGLTSFKTSGADYAEYFEWQDGNPQAADRVGRFVTLRGSKIAIAAPGDFVLGVVSGQPCIIGNADEDWQGRWQHDAFGRFLKRYMVDTEEEIAAPEDEEACMELLADPQVRERDGAWYRVTTQYVDYETPSWDYVPNPAYDSTQPYMERRDRPEWDAVGMLGVLPVWDDGACEVDGWCQPAANGTATAAESYIPGQTYRVLARVSENVVKILFR